MRESDRNSFEHEGWRLSKLFDFGMATGFDCGHADLNDYFRQDALPHRDELLAETYALVAAREGNIPVALLSLCNDSVRIEKVRDHLDLPETKRYPVLPAVKIARFGVNRPFQCHQLGSLVINLTKLFFLTDNRTGCRLITVDAYNEEAVTRFYGRNDFQFFSDKDRNKPTRAMFFDLKRLKTGVG